MIDRFDHVVITVADLEKTQDFYVRGLGMRAAVFDGKHALHFGRQKINVHVAKAEAIMPRATQPVPGSADFCFIADRPLQEVVAMLRERGLAIELGPVEREGALGLMDSVYLRDPDGNLVEIAFYRAEV